MRNLLVGALLAVALPATAAAQQNVIGPNGIRQPAPGDQPGNWWRDQQGGAFIDVTRNNPRVGFGGYGEGSLEMSVSGVRDPVTGFFPDWGFYYRYANQPGGFGSLAALSNLSFDWFRTPYSLPSPTTFLDGDPNRPIPPVDWLYKTPVLRLVLQHEGLNGPILSELIWEGYYNQQVAGGIQGPTLDGVWNTAADLQLGNFWYARPPASSGDDLLVETGGCGLNSFTFWEGGATGSALEQLLGNGGCLNGLNPIVVGVGVGVGSNWPLAWHGYVDNVRMDFMTPTGTVTALNANFDYVSTVPEPGSVALLATGLVGLAAAAHRKRRRQG